MEMSGERATRRERINGESEESREAWWQRRQELGLEDKGIDSPEVNPKLPRHGPG